jgi:hypothetical protein
MTRREFTRRIAESYARFEADVRDHHSGGRPAPLDREWAFSTGRRIVVSGDYRPRVRYLDYERVAREARRQLPAARVLIAEVDKAYPEHACAACGGTIRKETAG